MQDQDSPDLVSLVAGLVHEAGRAPVAAGQTLAHAADPSKVRPFVEWADLPEHVREGRRLTATNLLARYEVRPGAGTEPREAAPDAEALAAALHESERDAIERGLVLVRLDRPWVPLADLPEAARAGRLRQARFLLEHLHFVTGQPGA